MEPVWPGDQVHLGEGIRVGAIKNHLRCWLAGGILFAGIPPSASGHGSEYVFAKLMLSPEPRRVILEVSLDFLGNPVVDSREQARGILSGDLLIESASGRYSIRDLGEKVSWSERENFDKGAPIPGAEHGDGEEHRLLVARVDLSDSEDKSLQLCVAEGSLQAVIFWVEEEAAEEVPDSVRRVFLVAGDRSMGVALPAKTSGRSDLMVWLVIALGIGLCSYGVFRAARGVAAGGAEDGGKTS